MNSRPPKSIALRVRDHVRLTIPELEVLKLIGEESVRKGTGKLTSRQLDRIIKANNRNLDENDRGCFILLVSKCFCGSPQFQ